MNPQMTKISVLVPRWFTCSIAPIYNRTQYIKAVHVFVHLAYIPIDWQGPLKRNI